MKKLLTLFVAFVLAMGAQAQSKHNVYVWVDGEYQLIENADSITFADPNTPENPPLDEMEAVDLGLSVKWSAWNLGGNAPADFGYYFAWGETEEKENYDWSTYKWGENSYTLTKYVNDKSFGKDDYVDDKLTLDAEDDAAQVLLGDGWRSPTVAEMQELAEQCEWTEDYSYGVGGTRITGPNGNSIFLPYAGRKYGDVLFQSNSSGYYWTSEIDDFYNNQASYLNTAGNLCEVRQYNRYFGFSIRPVKP